MDVEVEWDHAQRAVVDRLEAVSQNLASRRRRHPRGVYLWGPVGRGKTVLMDSFFAKAPGPKRRVHFHEFFDGLHRHAHTAGSVDRALTDFLRGVRLLCFDEFHVHDVGDATLVALLLKHVDERKIALVVTSNYPPEGLLPNPLFHHVFVPSIEWIGKRLDVLAVDAGIDYRTGGQVNSGEGQFASGRYVVDRSPALPRADLRRTLWPSGRPVTALDAHGDEVWFGFSDLCAAPTAASDYLALAERFRMWTISGVPRLGDVAADPVRRFGNVVDVLYDANVSITVIADEPLIRIVEGADGMPDLDRLRSRLSLLPSVNG